MADMEAVAQALVDAHNLSNSDINVQLLFHQYDILRGGNDHDLTDSDLQLHIINSIHSGSWDVVLVAPPCETWSRVLFSNSRGPRPQRNRKHPWGIPQENGQLSDKIIAANNLLFFCSHASHLCGYP